MNKTSKLHMTTDEFRKEGYKVIDWIAEYYENIESYPVLSKVKPRLYFRSVSYTHLTLPTICSV